MRINWEVIGWTLLVLLFLISFAKADGIPIQASPTIRVVSQTYMDSYLSWNFTQIDNKTWLASFTVDKGFWNMAKSCALSSTKETCYSDLCNAYAVSTNGTAVFNCSAEKSKLQADLLNITNYPLTAVTKDITLGHLTIDTEKGEGSFTISFPNGFKVGESAKFGFGTTVINTSTTAQAIVMFGQQDRSFHASGLFWNWYVNGTNISYSCSVDGVTFVNQTAVRPCNTADCYAADFSIWYNGTYVSYAYSDRSTTKTPMYYRRGTPNSDCSITWSAAEQVAIAAAATALTWRYPSLAVDDQGYPWIAYVNHTSYPYITKSSTNDGTWTTAAGFSYQLNTTSSTGYVASVIPLTGGKVLAAYCTGSGRLYIRSWTGAAWNSVVNSSSTCAYANMHDVVAEGDDAHFVFISSSAIKYLNYTYTTNLRSSETTLVTGGLTATTHPYLTYNGTGTLYMFYSAVTGGVGTINYTTKNQANVWSGRTFWFTLNNLTNTADYMSPYYQSRDYYIGLMAMQNYTPSLFNITFSFLNYSTPAGLVNNATVTDYAIYGESTSFLMIRVRFASDYATYGQNTIKQINFMRVKSDFLTYAENIGKSATFQKLASAFVTYGEGLIKTLSFPRISYGYVTYGESITKLSKFSRTATDNATYYQSIDRRAKLSKTLTDYATYGENVLKSAIFGRIMSDYATYGESITKLSVFGRTATDNATYYENILYNVIGAAAYVNNVTVSSFITYYESVTKLSVFARQLSSPVIYGQGLIGNSIFGRAMSDYITYYENINGSIPTGILTSITIGNFLNYGESVTQLRKLTRQVSDSLTYAENAIYNFIEQILQVSSGAVSVVFPCNATSKSGEFVNVSLYINTAGAWGLNDTQAITGTANETNFTKLLSMGTYVWNCEWCTASACAFAEQNQTMMVNLTQPQFMMMLQSAPTISIMVILALIGATIVMLYASTKTTNKPLQILLFGISLFFLSATMMTASMTSQATTGQTLSNVTSNAVTGVSDFAYTAAENHTAEAEVLASMNNPIWWVVWIFIAFILLGLLFGAIRFMQQSVRR